MLSNCWVSFHHYCRIVTIFRCAHLAQVTFLVLEKRQYSVGGSLAWPKGFGVLAEITQGGVL